ncbi:hypothetical protein LPJ77_001244 [Coemansia sp. RSA 2523]|nr:hypothetical protein LPJ54_000802 [Coemansia sp. RSA 1824]KAJ1809985.1 hypothetical protein LPJ77_001244 [Coemansia sp. RSA 2523]KAJ2150742.1 hypothetical protein J3F82_003789 [Coemansia sp. RSA 637]KAJ2164610.1 hypothetical protein GGH15_003838 [Coemansia sp. RSA 562]KAJ2187144.1 hypothetical protein EV181_002924 [Coemansia sp. RSA 532]KAJ2204149.1 hypothetical protein IW145_003618 [Coemansia sp. RSA 521]KAJ2228609.1 hypothetical protein EV180_001904 [Coemansia sp. RSA 518]KAJ2250000.1 h
MFRSVYFRAASRLAQGHSVCVRTLQQQFRPHKVCVYTYPRFKSTGTPSIQPSALPTAANNPKEARMLIGFTCKVCNHRQHKTMSKNSYQNGVVLIQCDSCKNRHLIADNLGWFRDKNVNVEDLMQEKGEQVRQLKSMDLLDDIEADKIQQAINDYGKPK